MGQANYFNAMTPEGAALSNLVNSLYSPDAAVMREQRQSVIEKNKADAALHKAQMDQYEAKRIEAERARREQAEAPLRVLAGLFGGAPQGQAVADYRTAGGVQSPAVAGRPPNDDEGNAMPPEPMPRPGGYTPQMEDLTNRIFATMGIAGGVPGKTNAEQITKGAGELQSQDIIARALSGALTPQQQSDVAGARSKPVFHEGAAGDTMNLFTGAQNQTSPLATGHIAELGARTGKEQAQAGSARATMQKTISETLPQVQVPAPPGVKTATGTVPARGVDVGKAATTAAVAPATELSPEALAAAAAQYRMTRTLPTNLGRGTQGAKNTTAILNMAAQQAAAEGKSAEAQAIQQISGKATAAAIADQTKRAAVISAFERNANMNADIALANSAKVDRTGMPVLNRWILAGQKDVLGDVDVHKFHQANETFINEYAKIMSGSLGNTAVSDSLRRETASMLATKDTPEQYAATVAQMKREMANRMKGFADEMASLTGSLYSSGAPAAPAQSAPDATAPAAPRTFATEADAQAAAAAGQLKPGDRITVSGVSGTWH